MRGGILADRPSLGMAVINTLKRWGPLRLRKRFSANYYEEIIYL